MSASRPLPGLFLKLGVLFACSTASAAAKPARAVWIWETETARLLHDTGFQRATASFLVAHHISTLYLYADEYQGKNLLTEEKKKFRKFIRSMHSQGFNIYALLGSADLRTPEYILPENRRAAERTFRNILLFNATSDRLARFDGINIDLEPYLLDDWESQREIRMRQYLELSEQWMQIKAKMKSTIPVGSTLPFWFDAIKDVWWNGKQQSLNQHVQNIYDYVAVMDYRNFAAGPDGMIAQAIDELAYADTIRKKIIIGIDTQPESPVKITFAGASPAYMESQLGLAEMEFSAHPSFSGFAIHNLSSYWNLTAEPERH
ncbi:MAG TPA: hypothetical protein VGK48_00405 [Terriglobia bacterium]|jgi:hypothetical protein